MNIPRRLTEDNYDLIQSLLKQGIPISKVAKLSGRGNSTCWRVNKSTDWQDYKKMMREVWLKYCGRKQTRLVKTETTLGNSKLTTQDPVGELEDVFNLLKEKIAFVVESAVEQNTLKAREQLEQQYEAELVDLRKIVEAAKQSNVFDNLRRKFMGQ